MIAEVYEAFIDAGADEQKAKEAAQAAYNDISHIEIEIAGMKKDIKFLHWKTNFMLAFQVAMLWKLFQ